MALAHLRSRFDLPRDQAYFNAAQIGPMPRAAIEAGKAAYERKARPWGRSTQHDFFDEPEALRAEAAKLFHARPGDIALTPAASYGLAAAARNLHLEPGQEILVLDGQFPSNVYTWRAMARRCGARVRTVARKDGQSWTEALLDAIGPQTGLAACAAVHWIDGGRIDTPVISAALAAHGAAFVLDLTQSLGVMDFDAARSDPDFAVAAAYKWLLAPYATGFLYVAERHQNGEPLEENWITRDGAEDFTRLIDYRDAYAPGARRFDMGERSSHQLVPAALEALRFINAAGVEALAAHCAQASAALAAAAAPMGLRDDTPGRAGHYLALSLPSDAPADIAARLAARGVHVSRRGPRLRVSAHVYNDDADIARFADALRAELA